MKISIFGLGYVGCVSAACLAEDGHAVVGVDTQSMKVDLINSGQSPIVEPGLAELLSRATGAGHLAAIAAAEPAVCDTDLSMICVGTPSLSNGNIDTGSLANVCRQIGEALRRKERYHVIIVRSTMLPGTMDGLVRPTIESASGLKAGVEFGLAVNPEFLREGSAIADFRNPPKTVIGAIDGRTAREVAALYDQIASPLIQTSVEIAEIVKYVDNAFHALKVAFGNEIGNVCKALDIDSHAVMEIFCQDRRLNLSAAYLKPGFAFGGSCLPKDLRALTYKARRLDLSLPVLDGVLRSNRQQIDRAVDMIVQKGRWRVGVLGIGFKAGTDDLRESPMVEVVEQLIGKGFDLRLFDSNVNLARLVGANREYIMRTIPHISERMVESPAEVLAHGDVIVVGNNDPAFHDVPARLHSQQVLVDMVRLPKVGDLNGRYNGINW